MYIHSCELHTKKLSAGRMAERAYRYLISFHSLLNSSKVKESDIPHDVEAITNDPDFQDIVAHVRENGVQFTLHFHPSYDANVPSQLLIIQPECENSFPKQAVLFAQHLLRNDVFYALQDQYALFDMVHVDSTSEQKIQPVMVTKTGHIIRDSVEKWAEDIWAKVSDL